MKIVSMAIHRKSSSKMTWALRKYYVRKWNWKSRTASTFGSGLIRAISSFLCDVLSSASLGWWPGFLAACSPRELSGLTSTYLASASDCKRERALLPLSHHYRVLQELSASL